MLARKKNIRVLVAAEPLAGGSELRPISGGLLIQQSDQLDAHGDNPANWTLATGSPADPATLTDLVFAWRACRAVKSNAIVIAADGATVGVGMGQVNRVDAARLAVERGGERVRGAVAASDAFFPFPTAWKRWPPRGHRGRPPRWLGARRGSDRSGGQGRCHPISHRGAALRALRPLAATVKSTT